MVGSTLAVWRGSPNHYTGRNGYRIDHITLHIMVGTLKGTDTCFQQASYRAASHYGVGGDGTIYQWVDETDGSWADANMASDCSGVTIEHAGGMAGIPVTDREIEASARLCADIARRYGWTRLHHDGLNGNVYLHREIPGTDHAGCPDRCVNPLPVQRIIGRANQLLKNDQGDDDMVSQDDINKIANAVWNFNQNGVKCRDRLQGIDTAANNAARDARDIKTVADRNDKRLYRILLSLKRACGIKDDDTDTVPDLDSTWTARRVYRITLMLKRFFGIGDKDTSLPDAISLTDETLDRIADRVAAKLADKEDKNE